MREEEDVSSCETGSSEGEEGEEEETEEGREDFIIEEEEDIIEEEDDFIIEEEDGSDDEEEDAWANARVMTKAEKNASVVAVKFDDEDDDEPAHWEAKADRVDPSSGLQNISRRLSPATDDILDFAIYLGMDPEEDREWVWLAEECLYAPLPKGWKQARDVSATGRGDTYYWREDDPDCATQWEHPLDPFFRKLFERLKAEKQQRIDDMKLGGRWSKFERRKRRSARPQSAMPLDRRNSGSRADRTELGVLRTVAKGTSQHLAGRTAVFDFDTTPKKKARPMSALPSRSSAPIVPLNEEDSEEILGGCHDLGESSPSRVKASSRVQPSGSLETYTRESDTVDTPAAEVTEMVLPTHPPFPEDKTRPLWWRKTPETKAVDLSHKVSPEDILELASYFDVELPDEAHLMWVIKLAALAPIPKGWRVCFDEFSTEHFFACEQTFRISRNHPLDPFFALLLEGERDAEAASGSMGAAHTDRVWLAFADDDDDVYYYDFSSNVTCYEQPEAVEKNVPMPLMITQFEAAAGREDFLAYRQALWNSLCGVYEEKSNSIPPIIGLPAAQLLGKEELVRTAMILDWIMQPKNEELQKALEVNNSLKAAVEGRRTTSEQLTRHITLTKK
uniref:WW domain-containing protein n=2 Tax=Mucochytrium quahogii TaxID=96639 RepID=A0A7S2R6H1_9STRA|mmetsp:Transcript_10150/g.22094  ORF Transcript_10150/g.22094 Transcript_10150/m.22094 type:complete len:619 (+) Transcript_10150:499-2355(+)